MKTIFPLFRIAQISVDILLVLVVYVVVFILRFEANIPEANIKQFWFFMPFLPVIRVISNYIMGLYYHLWKYFGMREMLGVFYASSIGSIIFAITVYITGNASFPRSIIIFEWAFIFLAFLMVRSSRRFSKEIINVKKKPKQRALIIGAGNAGQTLVAEMLKNPENTYMPIGFIDDDLDKIKAKIHGVKVFGGRKVITNVVRDWEIDLIIMSIPSATPDVTRDILDICSKTKADIKIVPAIHEIINGKVNVSDLREIKIEDLLGRKPIILDQKIISDFLKNKTILITGAGGSIGSELCLQLAQFNPEKMILLGHGENSIFKISSMLMQNFPHINQVRAIADIKDLNTLDNIFLKYKPQVVFHAAAHKHVPLMEENIFESISNNVVGTKNMVEISGKYNVDKFVNISTDKAVNPTSIMGVTKRIAELIVKYGNNIFDTSYMTVRFGNVIGSRGSVIPIFQKQITDRKPITVTHPEMTRYFMTIPEAVQLVMQAGGIGKGNEIFVLDMGAPIKISDLAENMIRLSGLSKKDIPIVYTGIREGEKLHEELFMDIENISKTKYEKIMVSHVKTHTENFISDIDILIKNNKDFNQNAVLKTIKKIIPTYKKINYSEKKDLILDNKLSK